MNIEEYIESGILETYVMGAASEAETHELLRLKEQHPQIKFALKELEIDLEHIAEGMAVVPPPGMWLKINDSIDDLIVAPKQEPLRIVPGREEQTDNNDAADQNKFIEVEYESSHMRVHKTWKWVFAAVFVLSKIFLICAIYFYLENRQAQEQIKELKSELKIKK